MNNLRRLSRSLVSLLGLASMTAGVVSAQVTTWRNDTARTGQNLHETQLTPQNVNPGSFGKIFTYKVDGYVYAQPLYLPAISVLGEKRNVIFIATEHDTVFAFDADQNVPLWKASLVDLKHGAAAGATAVPSADLGTHDIVPEVGITATPVIDAATNTIYVEAKSKENGQYIHRLHALDATTGDERPNSPVMIAPSIAGTGAGSVNGQIAWQGQWQMCRPGLLLLNGKVYMAFASHGDNGAYHGWVLGYDAATLAPAGVYNTAPNGSEAGIWQSGAGLAADTLLSGGRMFVVTGNGDTSDGPPYTDTQSYGNAIERLDLANGIHVTDQWTPFDTDALSAKDFDQGSGGIVLLPDQPGPHPHLLVQIGKNGRIEVLDRDNLGGFDPAANHIAQEIDGQVTGQWSTPAYWNGNLYMWGYGDVLKQFSVANGQLSTTPVKQSQYVSDFPGATATVSSNGTANGILWTLRTDAYWYNGASLLCAFDATDVSKLLYVSSLNNARDAAGPAVKFTVPTVVNGRVYVGAQGEVDVYGLLASVPPAVPNVAFTPAPGTYASAQTVTMAVAQQGATIYYTTDGTTPTPASIRYTGPVTVNDTTAFQAMAVAPGLADSGIKSANYTIGNAPAIDFSNGFSSIAGMTLNGSAVNKDDSRLQLTTGGLTQNGSAFWNTPVNVQRFTTSFTFQLSGTLPLADGFTFTLQNADLHALGPIGGGLGYGPDQVGGTPGIANSVAIKFDLWNNRGEGYDSTGLYVNGASPTLPSIDLSSTGIDLSSGDTFNVTMTYDGTTLFFTLADPVAKTVFTTSYKLNIAQTIGSNTAYAGFTGATGGYTASQKILTWTYTPNPDLSKLAPVAAPVLSPAPGVYPGAQNVTIQAPQWDATIYYTTDGTTPTTASLRYTGPVAVASTGTLQAIASAPGFRDSTPAGGSYVIAKSTEPVLGPAGGGPAAAGTGLLIPVAADFNGDGKMDLAVVNTTTGIVGVLAGKGDGTFLPAVSYTTGRGPSGLAAGDLNGDGKADLLVVNKAEATLAILLNRGDGTFPAQPSSFYSLDKAPVRVAVADVDGDGNLDAVVAYYGVAELSVLIGKGDGTFQAAVPYNPGTRPYGVATADFNGDGSPDLLVWNSAEDTVGVLLNDRTGKFLPETASATGGDPSSVALADLDGDGFPDAVVANLTGNTVSVLINDGTGKLRPQVAYPTGQSPSSVLAIDMNGDGIPDLVVANLADGSLGVLLGKGDGTFLPQAVWPLGTHPYLAVTADFNGDGLPDIALSNFGPTLTLGAAASPKGTPRGGLPQQASPITVLLQSTPTR